MSVPVCVLNLRGKPLMPTTLKKAKVIPRLPFTIQLQDITLGIGFGYMKGS